MIGDRDDDHHNGVAGGGDDDDNEGCFPIQVSCGGEVKPTLEWCSRRGGCFN